MRHHLTIDRGNTTTKVAVWDGQRHVMTKSLPDATVDQIVEAVRPYGIDSAIFCTVAGTFEGLEQRLADLGATMLTLTYDLPLPLTIGYATPSTLGPDRIAAAVGAASEFPGRDLLIVDIGTAVTYDRVDPSGCYIGGNIAPGIGMRLRALHAFTAALPEVKSQGEIMLWGDTTETAMRAGAVRGVVAEISYYRSQMPADSVVVLTGGWSKDIAAMLDFKVEVSELLVTKGLNCILQYNENLQTNHHVGRADSIGCDRQRTE